MKLRTVFFWSHLIGGVSAGIVILIMSLTGALLTYERQLIEWSDRAFRVTPSADAQRLPVQALMDQVTASHPDIVPTAVTVRADREAPVTINAGQRTVYVNPYNAQVIGEPTTDIRRWMSELRAWHRWLAIEGPNRPVARAITGWSNAIFLFIVLSGMYLWMPRRWSWQNVKAITTFRSGLSSKARDFNWHNVIGIWSAVPLALVVATAMPISFPWANNLDLPGRWRSAAAAGWRAGRTRRAARRQRGSASRLSGREPGRTLRTCGAAGRRLAEHQPAPPDRRGCAAGVRRRSGERRPAAAALHVDARCLDRRRCPVGNLREPEPRPAAAQLVALHPHGRSVRTARADDRRIGFGGRRRAGLHGTRARLAAVLRKEGVDGRERAAASRVAARRGLLPDRGRAAR